MLNKMWVALRNKFNDMAIDWHYYDTFERVSVCALALVCLAVLVGVMLLPGVRLIVGFALSLALMVSIVALALNGIEVLFERR